MIVCFQKSVSKDKIMVVSFQKSVSKDKIMVVSFQKSVSKDKILLVCFQKSVTKDKIMILCFQKSVFATYPRERPGTHCTGGWVGLRAGLDRCGKSHPYRDFFLLCQSIMLLFCHIYNSSLFPVM